MSEVSDRGPPSIDSLDGEEIDDDNELLLRNLEENVITKKRNIRSVSYYCAPCNAEVTGIIYHHLRGRKHVNSSLYEVLKNPVVAPSSLKKYIPKIILEAAIAKEVLGVNPTSFQCLRCEKALNGIKPLASHLDTHTSLPQQNRILELCIKENINGSKLQSVNSTKAPRGKVLIFEYSFMSVTLEKENLNPLKETSDLQKLFQNMDYEVECLKNLSHEETMQVLTKTRSSDNLIKMPKLICIITGPGSNQRFLTYNGKALEFTDVVNNFDDKNCPYLRGKPKLFIANFHSSSFIKEMTGVLSSSNISESNGIIDKNFSKNVTSIIATTPKEKTNFVKIFTRRIESQPKLELRDLYLKMCDEIKVTLDRIEYHNYQASNFYFF